jgi:hypothetical protein
MKLEDIKTHIQYLQMMKDVLKLGTLANEALDYAIELAKKEFIEHENRKRD